ncbi:ABC transporter permease [Cellulomonas marina]|uniref:Peptide/nickel transport system permease protein n=1 Tax=Cellulomonas marina TaxID=988821 RepID=A0A1I0ZLX4_9CELL|nr:ABC transporter permease [Cellulomonas marina]GIG28595.1 ABC transporter permease [Cellulomonas marina]SFB25193.1 peptide/nickel transport system permease protein [Cellulomonas marina]
MSTQDTPRTPNQEPAGAQEHLENAIELQDVAGLSQGQIVRRRFLRHKGAIVGMVVLAAIVVLSLTSVGFGPVPGWWKYTGASDPVITNPGGRPTLSMPTWLGGEGFAIGEHPLGQDEIGRDIFAQVMKGVQTSLMVIVVVGAVSTAIGVLVGALAGFYRGRLDTALMRSTDLVITMPTIVIGAVVGKLAGGISGVLFALALGLILWPSLARLVRGEFLALREREFVDAARVAGSSSRRIIFKHILPNAIGVVIVSATLLMSQAILLEAALSYLGFGITPPEVSLGQLISIYQSAFATRPWLFWWPGLFIVLIALCINFIGDGLRDAFDPRQKRIPSQRAMDRAAARSGLVPTSGTAGGTSLPGGAGVGSP